MYLSYVIHFDQLDTIEFLYILIPFIVKPIHRLKSKIILNKLFTFSCRIMKDIDTRLDSLYENSACVPKVTIAVDEP